MYGALSYYLRRAALKPVRTRCTILSLLKIPREEGYNRNPSVCTRSCSCFPLANGTDTTIASSPLQRVPLAKRYGGL